jgi:hypothetical protein
MRGLLLLVSAYHDDGGFDFIRLLLGSKSSKASVSQWAKLPHVVLPLHVVLPRLIAAE